MDILYYSNHCKHSQKVIQYLVKNNFSDKLNFICIDKRRLDSQTNQTMIFLENGKTVVMPPNIHSVPSLLLVKQNYRAVLGDEIIAMFKPAQQEQTQFATQFDGEPAGFQLNGGGGVGGASIVSEQFTFYNMSPEELSSKGKGGMRQMGNYVSAQQNGSAINTPPDTYRPDKLSSGVTLDTLQQQRNSDIQPVAPPNPFI